MINVSGKQPFLHWGCHPDFCRLGFGGIDQVFESLKIKIRILSYIVYDTIIIVGKSPIFTLFVTLLLLWV
jgi:hypothetical protein